MTSSPSALSKFLANPSLDPFSDEKLTDEGYTLVYYHFITAYGGIAQLPLEFRRLTLPRYPLRPATPPIMPRISPSVRKMPASNYPGPKLINLTDVEIRPSNILAPTKGGSRIINELRPQPNNY